MTYYNMRSHLLNTPLADNTYSRTLLHRLEIEKKLATIVKVPQNLFPN